MVGINGLQRELYNASIDDVRWRLYEVYVLKDFLKAHQYDEIGEKLKTTIRLLMAETNLLIDYHLDKYGEKLDKSLLSQSFRNTRIKHTDAMEMVEFVFNTAYHPTEWEEDFLTTLRYYDGSRLSLSQSNVLRRIYNEAIGWNNGEEEN